MEKMVKKVETNNLPRFEFQGRKLPLDEIAKKKVTSVTFLYLSQIKIKKSKGLWGILGGKKIIQELREVTIEDSEGIKISFFPANPTISIHFSKKCEWDKIIDFDHLTVLKDYESIIFKSYYFVFSVANLKEVK